MKPIQRLVIVHGFLAAPGDHWFPWLAARAADRGIVVDVIAMPNSAAPEKGAWLTTLRESLPSTDSATVLLGHSLGCAALLGHLGERADDWRLGGLVLVSGFADRLSTIPQIAPFTAEPFAYAEIIERTGTIVSIASDNDEIVTPSLSAELAAHLQSAVVTVPGAGHFLGRDGHMSLAAAESAVFEILGTR